MRIGSLFAGIGGFDLAAQWVGWETAWFSEIDPYASAVLKKHWPHVPNLGDIMHIGTPPKVDLLCGGFPCQDISNAGQRAGITGERSGLWKEYVRLIQEIRPRWIVAENVAALRSRGLDTVLSDLAQIGYDAEWHCIPASAVGAPHQRDRIWIVAYPQRVRELQPEGGQSDQWGWTSYGGAEGTMADTSRQLLDGSGLARTTRRSEPSDRSEEMANANEPRLEVGKQGAPGKQPTAVGGSWWSIEPDVGRVAHGVSSRVDRLRCLGNAIVPQVASLIFKAIALEDMIGAAA